MPQCVIRNLRKSYGRVLALKDVDLEINKGEIVAVLGPSGCGKSTLLQVTAGLLQADDGEILIEGKEVYSKKKRTFVPPESRNLALMFQSYALWPHKTVAENIAYPLKMRKTSSKKIDAEVDRMLEMVKLEGSNKVLPSELSGGQQQRVALARALVSNPSLLLLDEPFSNLDAKLRQQMQAELKALVADLNLSVLHVTHDQTEALALADKIVLMDSGIVVESGNPRELYQSPNTLFAGQFMGSSNIFVTDMPDCTRASIYGDKVTSAIDTDEIQIASSEEMDLLFGSRKDGTAYLVRPSDVILSKSKGLDVACVKSALYKGSSMEYKLQYRDIFIHAEVPFYSYADIEQAEYEPGDFVHFDFARFKEISNI